MIEGGSPDPGRVETLVDRIAATRPARPGWATLVALSGIDGAGKGALAAAAAAELERRGLHVALVALDDWHRPPQERFSTVRPGEHFYASAFDIDAVLSRVIGPLRTRRSLRLEVVRPHPFDGRPARLRYDFTDVDVVIFEGIFLLRRELRDRYDLGVWVECPFDVALERALRRNQEGLPATELAAHYERIYFAAQRIHLERDRPGENADLVIENGGPAAIAS